MLKIPRELQQYMSVSKKEGEVYSGDMTIEIRLLLEKTKKSVIEVKQRCRNELEKLIAGEE